MVLEIYEIYVHGQNDKQTENPTFYNVQTYLDRLHVLEMYVIPNFVKIVGTVLEIANIYIPTHTYVYIYTILPRLIISGDSLKY